MTEVCEHGAQREAHKSWPDGLAFTESLNPCSCCATLFYVIERSEFAVKDDGSEVKASDIWEPKDRCAHCGGHYVHIGPSWEEMGWQTMCNGCKKWFKPSELAAHECPSPDNSKSPQS